MSDLLEVVNGISQALSEKYDGGAEFGLEREQKKSMYEKRLMDGFGVSFHGNYITVKYHSDFPLEKVHKPNFDVDVKQTINEVVKNIKEKYKSVKKKTLQLKECGDIDIVIQTPNRRTAFVNAAQTYELVLNEKEDKLEASFSNRSDSHAKHWLKMMKR